MIWPGRRLRAAPAAVLALLACVPLRLEAQSPVLLSPSHWSVQAVRRLDALGALAETVDYGRRRVTLGEIGRLLREAKAPDGGVAASLLAGYRTRFRREFAEVAEADPGPWLSGSTGPMAVIREGEFGTQSGRVAAGPEKSIMLVDLQPAPRRPDGARLRPGGWLGLGIGRFGAAADARSTPTGDMVYEGHGAVRAAGVSLWAGRLAPGYGPGRHGSQVLSGDREVVGGGFSTGPFRLPWILKDLGDVRVESFFGGLDRSREIEDPLLWSMRASVVPHPRVGFGLTRAAMFGGEGNSVTFQHFLEILFIDRHAGVPFENQVGAIDLWFRPPLGDLPLVGWVEWGSDDTSGGLFQVPGLLTGVSLPVVPGAPSLGITLETMWMAGQCCGNGPWYWHTFFASGWAVDGRLFGHPLGGQGREVLLGFDLSPAASPATASLDLFRRDRGPENRLAPVWEGVSHGVEVRTALETGPWELSVLGYVEDGNRWRRGGVSLNGRVRF